MKARLLFVHALSPLHAGTGQGVGVIDLPIAREKATGLPYLPGSSVKGTLRASHPDKDKSDRERRQRVFGPDTQSAEDHAGSVQFSDQRLLLLPVRSLLGTFAWVTSPYILRRFLRDIQETTSKEEVETLAANIPTVGEDSQCRVSAAGCNLWKGGQGANANTVYLEDLDLAAIGEVSVSEWARWLGERLFPGDAAWQEMLTVRFCVIHDDAFNFLLATGTEIIARNRLQEESKTVAKGALWYEEALPAESVLAGLVVETRVKAAENEVFQTVAELTDSRTLQFGGKATVGRGLCRVRLA